MEAIQTGKESAVPSALRAGDRYRVGAGFEDDALARPAVFPETMRVGYDGGLLSHLTVRRNLVLPLEYHGRDISHAEEDAALLLALCGEDAASADRLLNSYPDALTLYERRLAGFVRALLVEPETMEMKDIFEGLSAEEQAKAMRWPEVFRMRFPFREMNYRKDGNMVSAGTAGGA